MRLDPAGPATASALVCRTNGRQDLRGERTIRESTRDGLQMPRAGSAQEDGGDTGGERGKTRCECIPGKTRSLEPERAEPLPGLGDVVRLGPPVEAPGRVPEGTLGEHSHAAGRCLRNSTGEDPLVDEADRALSGPERARVHRPVERVVLSGIRGDANLPCTDGAME